MPVSREKEERMWRFANRMAESGEYDGWHQIESELRQLGFVRARQLLDDEGIRERLDQQCATAKARAANA